MKVIQINTTCDIGSTGKICVGISNYLYKNNIDNYILYCNGSPEIENRIKYASKKYIKLQAAKSRILGNYGFNSNLSTCIIISKIKELKPDIVHIHNIHSHDCNLKYLFNFLKKEKIKTIWTFHDCWAITGYCTHFDMIMCDKWVKECCFCPQYKKYSLFFDRSKVLFKRKKKFLSGCELLITTPSQWMAKNIKRSFLGSNHVVVINNGVNLNVFKNRPSNFREEYGISNKKVMLLGVSFDWNQHKGLDTFVSLTKKLDKDKYQIVLVGTNEEIDKVLPESIISIHKTSDQIELAEIYSAADLFINPTLEEAFGMVNVESLACGTPVITYNTGGCSEIVDDSCGKVIDKGDFSTLVSQIESWDFGHSVLFSDNCVKKAQCYDENKIYNDYLRVYREMLDEK